MGCVFALVAWLSPRFALFLMQLFTDRLERAFDSFLIGLLGFIFLPYTAVFYALAHQPGTGVQGFGWFIVGLGVLFDVSSWGAGGDRANRRYRR